MKNNLSIPLAIIISCLILGGFYYATQVSKQNSIERQQQAELEVQERTEQSTQREKFRLECESIQNENIEKFEDFLNTCEKYNSQDYCLDSEAGKLFQSQLSSDSIQTCIDTKMLNYQ